MVGGLHGGRLGVGERQVTSAGGVADAAQVRSKEEKPAQGDGENQAPSVAAWSAGCAEALGRFLACWLLLMATLSPSWYVQCNLRCLPPGITILQFVHRIELSFIMFSIQNQTALEGPHGFVLLRASKPFPVGFAKLEGIGLQGNTVSLLTYIHDRTVGICL
jgi:hypothetical protein